LNIDKLSKHLDPSRLAVTEAVFGVLLAALAVEMAVSGMVYRMFKDEKIVKVIRMWTRYE
jgi:hypothetical protein